MDEKQCWIVKHFIRFTNGLDLNPMLEAVTRYSFVDLENMEDDLVPEVDFVIDPIRFAS